MLNTQHTPLPFKNFLLPHPFFTLHKTIVLYDQINYIKTLCTTSHQIRKIKMVLSLT